MLVCDTYNLSSTFQLQLREAPDMIWYVNVKKNRAADKLPHLCKGYEEQLFVGVF